MKARVPLYKAGALVFVAALFVACSGGGISPPARGGATRPGSSGHARRPMFWNLGQTQPLASGEMLIPLTLTVSGSTGQIAVFGSTYCTAASGPNPCPNVNFSASPPQYYSNFNVSFTLAAVTLNATCSAPSGAPTPAPGFVAACYVVAYEGGVGPYVLQGPATSSGGTVSFAAQSSTLNLESQVPYNIFLAYVTSVSSPPPPPTASPLPSPTYYATEPPPATPTPTPFASLTPSPCPSTSSDDDESACGTPTPSPTPTACDDDGHHGHHHHHHRRHTSRRGDDDCADS